jgi:hypothetical protein
MLCLSATVRRKDRMDRCLEWFVGHVAFRAEMQPPHEVVQVVNQEIFQWKNERICKSRNILND